MLENQSLENAVLLDDVLGDSARLFAEPIKIVQLAETSKEEIIKAFEEIEQALDEGLWAAGFLSYDLGHLLEEKLENRFKKDPKTPLLWFGLYPPPQHLKKDDVDKILITQNSSVLENLKPRLNSQDYNKRFNIARKMIASGDIYQLNLTFKADFTLKGSPFSLYKELRNIQPVNHGAFIHASDFSVLSLSPELFLKRDGVKLETRPMKGTQARYNNVQQDESAKFILSNDEKQRAENLMIVDLMRNDISRIAKVGSVKVPGLFEVETYPSLHQMISRVEGELEEEVSLFDIFKALFPAGSITGAPKIRAMQLINDLEKEPRGLYCGSIGFIAPNRDFNFNVAIRTAFITPDGRGEIGIGSGVVADSKAEGEFAEALLKMRFLEDVMDNFQLFETMLFESDKGIWLLDKHMERLEKSAKALGFAFDGAKVLEVIAMATIGQKNKCLRLRLALDKDGAINITQAEMPNHDKSNPAPITCVISKATLSSDEVFLRYKTTKRKLYDEEFRIYNDKIGAGEVIYFNEKDELCEGSRTNIFLEINGKLVTPPLSCGLLPGTLRARLLEKGVVEEKVLTLSDLKSANKIYLGNSVRGMQEATLVQDK